MRPNPIRDPILPGSILTTIDDPFLPTTGPAKSASDRPARQGNTTAIVASTAAAVVLAGLVAGSAIFLVRHRRKHRSTAVSMEQSTLATARADAADNSNVSQISGTHGMLSAEVRRLMSSLTVQRSKRSCALCCSGSQTQAEPRASHSNLM